MVGILACHVGDRHILIGELDGLTLMKVKQDRTSESSSCFQPPHPLFLTYISYRHEDKASKQIRTKIRSIFYLTKGISFTVDLLSWYKMLTSLNPVRCLHHSFVLLQSATLDVLGNHLTTLSIHACYSYKRD